MPSVKRFISDLSENPCVAQAPPSTFKRARVVSPLCLSPTTYSSSSNPINSTGRAEGSFLAVHLAHLKFLFPELDEERLERVLEENGDDLEAAIKSLSNLKLGYGENNSSSSGVKPCLGIGTEHNIQLPTQGTLDNVVNAVEADLPNADSLPQDGTKWVDILMNEMGIACSIDDARARSLRVFQMLEKCISARASAQSLQSFQKENTMLKEQIASLSEDNKVLKRAFALLHDRQKDYDDKNRELQNLNQLASQYQEQIKHLEVTNYALSMHLRQAQQNSSIPGHFHPDIF